MKESNISKLIEIEASKYGCITLRLNSGKFYQGILTKTRNLGVILTKLRHIEGCPEGTSDLLIIAPNSKSIFCETKTLTGKQRESQKKFQDAITNLGHTYIIARNVEDLENGLKQIN
jgi:hypothetical protein